MAEEEYMEEEAPLSAEELFEQHKEEINAAFEEKGFFKRLSEMFSGLSKPHSSAEYKKARTELQRLAAPMLALLCPVLFVVILCVVTQISGQAKQTIQVDVARAQDEVEELTEEEPPPEPEDTPPPEEPVEVQVDTPTVATPTDIVTPSATPTSEPVSVKPAAQDSVALIKSPVTMKSMTGSRTPGSIGKFTRGGASYGDAATEGAVLKALRWLKKTQGKNGAWTGDIACTALAILAYLAHGETPGSKEFGETVEKAIQFLIDAQTMENGVCKFRGAGGSEYGYLICTYALCEAYGMTKNPNAKITALTALQRIVDNQSPTGGWDYNMKKDSERDDMSFEGWALQAIKAGKMAGLHPEGLDMCIKKAIKCLKTRNFKNGGFNYTANGGPTGLTATGCLCMQLLGFMNEPEVKAALETMRGWLPVFEAKGGLVPGGPTPGSAPQYYCYYASQCKYQAGMCAGATPADVKSWQEWNLAMKALYPKTITDAGTIMGIDGKEKACGFWKEGYNSPTMGTCLVALQLMVYYRYLPTTQTKAAKVEGHDDDKKKKSAGKKKSNDVAVDVDI